MITSLASQSSSLCTIMSASLLEPSSSSSFPFKFSKLHSSPPSLASPFRVFCRAGPPPADFKFLLHQALDSSGIDTTHARGDARRGFLTQIEKLTIIERETSITINRLVDLGKAALFIAAEDDSLVSHSSVPLPVDAFVDRLYDLSMGVCSDYSFSLTSSPEKFLDSLERYLYVKKGFRGGNGSNQSNPRALYLHSVLTHRSGSAAMLSLIYSEILKLLRM